MNASERSNWQFFFALVVALALLALFLAFTHAAPTPRPTLSPPAAVRSLASLIIVGSG